MKDHWIVYGWTGSGFYGDDTPNRALFSTRDEIKLHWGGNMQWTDKTDKMVLLHDYGWIDTMDEDAIQAVFKDYDERFPIEPYDIDRAISKDVSGYLAPDGKLYRCHYMGHSQLADDLCNMIGLEASPDDIFSRNPSVRLIAAGWLELRSGYIGFEDCNLIWATPVQVTVLKRLYSLNEGFSHYQNGITEFLDRLKPRTKGNQHHDRSAAQT